MASSRSRQVSGPSPWMTSKSISWSVTVFTSPSEHSSRYSPACIGHMYPSQSAEMSGPRARVIRFRLGCRRASSAVMSPRSTMLSTREWSLVMRVMPSSLM